jgi:ATP-dependent helicase/nuclease subunit A
LRFSVGEAAWVGRNADDVPSAAVARNAVNTEAEHEYRRLLYVAMTRAANRLIVCGADGERKRPNGCWYGLIRDALDPFLVAEGEDEEKVLLYRREPADSFTEHARPVAPVVKIDRPELPQWLRQPAPPEARRMAWLSPSSAFDEEIGREFARTTGSVVDRRKALARGRIVHRLMQSLPDIPPAGRKDAIARYLNNAAAEFLPAEQADIAQQVLTILNDLIFAEVFAPGSRAEVPIVGRLAGGAGAPIAVAGQVDRLAVTRDAVMIADYKTDRAAPAALADVPKPYIGQLALYRAVLGRIYPEKTIRAALVFTEGPKVIEVLGAAMETALAEILKQSHAPVKFP